MSDRDKSGCLPPYLLRQVDRAFPEDFLSLDPEDLEHFGADWTRVVAARPRAIAFPRTTDEVSRLLQLCDAMNVPVVPSGGRTGLAGGAVAGDGELVVSLSRMRHMDPVCAVSRTVRVQAGAVTQAVHSHCLRHGLTWPVDLAAAGSSQIGGNVATNAGGKNVVRYGPTRQWVLGLQAVTMGGGVLELNGALEKNNTGYDLRQLLIGSEGTLAVITEATLKLTSAPKYTQVGFFGVSGLSEAVRLFRSAREDGDLDILAFEYLADASLACVLEHGGWAHPLNRACPAYVLTEIAGTTAEHARAAAERWAAGACERGALLDGVLAESTKDARALWALREGVGDSLARRGMVHTCDVSLPVARFEAFGTELDAVFRDRYPTLGVFLCGHVGDGNLHINVLKPGGLDKEAFLQMCHHADKDVFALVQSYNGSVSAEHGIGLLKKAALGYTRTPAELELFRSIKRAFDPKGLLNPGKIFD